MKSEHRPSICLTGIIPMRAEPSEKSEMVSQLLFGETFTVVQSKDDRWLYVCTDADAYFGWISANSAIREPITRSEKIDSACVVSSPMAVYATSFDGRLAYLPGGSILPKSYDLLSFETAGTTYTLVARIPETPAKNPVASAKQYLGAPYLWGGKTILGIDCSGLMQVIFRMHGIMLPRDASQQEQTGETVAFDSVRAGDVAFFCNEDGKVVHTGILYDTTSIIHASGSVRIDRIDRQGIFNESEGRYTHHLHSIKRYA